jgi:hypothetical protein
MMNVFQVNPYAARPGSEPRFATARPGCWSAITAACRFDRGLSIELHLQKKKDRHRPDTPPIANYHAAGRASPATAVAVRHPSCAAKRYWTCDLPFGKGSKLRTTTGSSTASSAAGRWARARAIEAFRLSSGRSRGERRRRASCSRLAKRWKTSSLITIVRVGLNRYSWIERPMDANPDYVQVPTGGPVRTSSSCGKHLQPGRVAGQVFALAPRPADDLDRRVQRA